MVALSVGEKNFIKGGIAQDLRNDGRKRLTYRPIYVETGVIPQANGSTRVKFGAIDVIASVKAELGMRVRFVYTLPSPDLTCGITLGLLSLKDHVYSKFDVLKL
ncbi:uncharacterized protein LOC132067329 [Lycium ferocissimum]|uniref:uncharacterized protein LOC132067329 n=1 Tax=Lycium ferocissimum TaxID=112874 RepID=UPI0028162DC4|nr:uncharacterized protein LOC132067329 [Lycium ferocissimum]